MKQLPYFLVPLFAFLVSCDTNPKKERIEKIEADSLIANVDRFLGKKVEIQGTIVHICGVSRKKMKLKSDGAQVLKIIPSGSLHSFDTSLYKKRVSIVGQVQKSQITLSDLEIKEKNKIGRAHV